MTAHRLVAGLVAFGTLALAPAPVAADPAGPTDYRSEVVSVDPPTPSIEIGVIGGDSFVQLMVDAGTDVLVLGYEGEENLWFRSDGSVWENRNSPSTYVNEERYGTEAPAFASADAPPDWEQVGTGGRWSWHDHRAHWMQRTRPLAAAPGDRILEAVIPLVVDGAEVDVTVISTWQPAPSVLPRWFGAGTAVLIVAAAWFAVRRSSALAVVGIAVASVALIVGAGQFASLPAETGPRPVWWVLPAVALASAGAAIALVRARQVFWALAAVVVTGVELTIWAWIRREGLTSAIIPTDLPGWLDRFVTSLALVVGVGLVAAALVALLLPDVAPGQADRRLSASRAQSG